MREHGLKKFPRLIRYAEVVIEKKLLGAVCQTDPKRVKKVLPKLLKTMKADDRVMIIGTTKSPFGKTQCIST